MALITKSRYGLVAVNNDVLKNIVSKSMSEMEGLVFPCNKRGLVYKRGFKGNDSRTFNSIEISEDSHGISIEVYYVSKFGESISDTASKLFDTIEYNIGVLRPEKHIKFTAHIKGVMAKQVVPRDITIIRGEHH